MATLYYDSSIAHFGILGMKWGVRRYQNKDGTLTAKGQKHYSAEMQKVASSQRNEQRRLALEKAKVREARKTEKARLELQKEKAALRDDRRNANHKQPSKLEKERQESSRNKKISEMSDDEIRSMINRISLERKLSELTAPPPPKQAPNWVKDIGKELVKNLAVEGGKALGKGAGSALSKSMFNVDPDQNQDSKKKKQ